MTDTIPQPPCDYAVGRAQKDIRDAAASARAVDYVDHTKWERIAQAEGEPGGYGFLWWCIAVVVIAVVAVWVTQ